MGKWLDRVVKGKDIQKEICQDFPKTHTDNVDRLPEPLDRLTDEGKEVYREYIEEMLAPKHGPPLILAAAKSLAMELVSCVHGNLHESERG